jgi:hypothetical protein
VQEFDKQQHHDQSQGANPDGPWRLLEAVEYRFRNKPWEDAYAEEASTEQRIDQESWPILIQ